VRASTSVLIPARPKADETRPQEHEPSFGR
jgi:hypothetical protein